MGADCALFGVGKTMVVCGDMACHQAIKTWGMKETATFVSSAELNYTKDDLATVKDQTACPIQLSQLTFGEEAKHPALRLTIDMLVANARKRHHLFRKRFNKLLSVVDKSGLGVFTNGVVAWLREQGEELSEASRGR